MATVIGFNRPQCTVEDSSISFELLPKKHLPGEMLTVLCIVRSNRDVVYFFNGQSEHIHFHWFCSGAMFM